MNEIKRYLKETGHKKLKNPSYESIYNYWNIEIIKFFVEVLNIPIKTDETQHMPQSIWEDYDIIIDEDILINGNINVLYYLHSKGFDFYEYSKMYKIKNLDNLKKIIDILHLKWITNKYILSNLVNIDFENQDDIDFLLNLIENYNILKVEDFHLILQLDKNEVVNALDNYLYKNTTFFIYDDLDKYNIDYINKHWLIDFLENTKYSISDVKKRENSPSWKFLLSKGYSLLEDLSYNNTDWNVEIVKFLHNELWYNFKNFKNDDYRFIMDLCRTGNVKIMNEIFVKWNYELSDFFKENNKNVPSSFFSWNLQSEEEILKLCKKINKYIELNIDIRDIIYSDSNVLPVCYSFNIINESDLNNINTRQDLYNKIKNENIIETIKFINVDCHWYNKRRLYFYKKDWLLNIKYFRRKIDKNNIIKYDIYEYDEDSIKEQIYNFYKWEYWTDFYKEMKEWLVDIDELVKSITIWILENIDIYYDDENVDIITNLIISKVLKIKKT